MHRLVAATVAAFAITLPFIRIAAAAPPPPAVTWSGYYIGGNIGYGWGDASTDIATNWSDFTFPGLPGVPNSYALSTAHTQKLNGVIGGGQVGFNYQYGPKWVFGVEADFQGTDQRRSETLDVAFKSTICNGSPGGGLCNSHAPFSGSSVTSYEARIDWFGTLRGRVGWLVTDQTLLYGTGGLAYGHVSVSGNYSLSAIVFTGVDTFGPGTGAFSASKTTFGFAVGGGIEGKFAAWLPQNWTWRLEYLYLDLGSLDASTSFVAASSNPTVYTSLTGTTTVHTHFTDNIVRFGLNYEFE